MSEIKLEYHKKYNKEYYNKNKLYFEIKSDHNRLLNKEIGYEKFKCYCSGKFTYVNKYQHFKTKKHSKHLTA